MLSVKEYQNVFSRGSPEGPGTVCIHIPKHRLTNAIEYAPMIKSKIILIDGDKTASLMAEHNVGVSTVGLYEVKKLDSDYFDEE